MTSHHDVAGVVAELRNGANVNGVGPRVANLAAEVLESQAKTLSEAEDDVGRADKGMDVWMKRALAAEARLAELSRAMTEVRDWLILAGDMTCREIPLGIIARAFTNAAKETKENDNG